MSRLLKCVWQNPSRLVSMRTSGSIIAAPIMYSLICCSTVLRMAQMGQPSRGSNTSFIGIVRILSLIVSPFLLRE